MIDEREEFEKWLKRKINPSAWDTWQARAALGKSAQHEPVAHTYGGFSGVFYQQNGRLPEAQEIWNAATRAALDKPDHAEVVADVIASAVARINATIIVEGETCEKLRSAIAARVADIAKATFTAPQPDHSEALAAQFSDRDVSVLRFVADRLEHVYCESPNIDYIQRLRSIADEMEGKTK